MGQADKIYDSVISDILANGEWDKGETVRTVWADGTPAYTKSLITTQMKFDGTEVPLLTKKHVAHKTAVKEIRKFWQEKTNSFESFHKDKIKIWDEWEIKEGEWAGTIGPSYGYQMGLQVRRVPVDDTLLEMTRNGYIRNWHSRMEDDGHYAYLDQVDYLLYQLKVNPSSRRHVTSLWKIDDLDSMALNPCVWNTQWVVLNGNLHLVVGVRSNDMALGNPFNVYQYYVLQRMIAQVTKLNMGTLTFNITNPHIYERHIDGVMEQLKQDEHEAPTLWLNPEVKSFYDFTMDDIVLENYQHGPKINFEVAI
jgi:thymidylate synthase